MKFHLQTPLITARAVCSQRGTKTATHTLMNPWTSSVNGTRASLGQFQKSKTATNKGLSILKQLYTYTEMLSSPGTENN